MDQCGEGVRPSCSPGDGLSAPVTIANRTNIGDGRKDVLVRDLLELSRTEVTKLFVCTNSLTSLQPPIPVIQAIGKRKRFSSASFSRVSVLESVSDSAHGPEWIRRDGPLGTDGNAGGHGCVATWQSDVVMVKCPANATESKLCCSAEVNESKQLLQGPCEAQPRAEFPQPGVAGREEARAVPVKSKEWSIFSELEKANLLALTLALEELRNRYRKLNERHSELFGSPESVVGRRKGRACESGSPMAMPKQMVDKATSYELFPVAQELTDSNYSQALPITFPGSNPNELNLGFMVSAKPPAEDETSLLLEAKAFPPNLSLSTLISPLSPRHLAIEPLAEYISLDSPFFMSLRAEESMKKVGGLTVQREESSKSAVTVPNPGHVRLCSYIDNETLPISSFMEPEEADLKPILRLTELSVDGGLADKDLTVVCSLPYFKLNIESVIQLNETKPLSSGQGPVHEKVLICPGQRRSKGEPSPARALDLAPVRVSDLTPSVEQREDARGAGAVEWGLSLHQGLDFFESEGNLLHNNLEWFPHCASTPLLRTKVGNLGTCSFRSSIHTSSSSDLMMMMGNATDGSGQSEASAAKERVWGGCSTVVLETKSGDKAASEPKASQQLKVETVDVSKPVANHLGARSKMLPFPMKPVGQTSTVALTRQSRTLVGTGIPLKKNHGLPKPGFSSVSALGRKANNSGGAEMLRSVADPPKAVARCPLARGANKGVGMSRSLPQPLPALPVLQETKELEAKPAGQQLNLFAGPRTRRNTREGEVRPNPTWRGGGRRFPLGPCEQKYNRLPHRAALGQVPGKTVWNLPGIGNWFSQRSQSGTNQQNSRAGAKPVGHGHLGFGDPAGSRSDQKAEGMASNILGIRQKHPSTTLLQGRLDSLPKRFKMSGEMPPRRRAGDVRPVAEAESLAGEKPKVKE